MYEKNPKCPKCSSFNTIRKGKRRGKVKYLCKECGSWFQINRSKIVRGKELLLRHVDGTSFRKLADQYNISTTTAYRRTLKTLRELPHCADITRSNCSRFQGVLVADGKFLKVRGYRDKIPVIYGIDYNTHDIPTYRLVTSESYLNWLKYFQSLRLLNYPLQALIADDNSNIKEACFKVYPKTIFQLCQNHYKENIKRSIDTLNNQEHLKFMLGIYYLFKIKRNEDDFNKVAKSILTKHLNNELLTSLMIDIDRRKPELLGYLRINQNLARTNNLIECYNSHIQGRLKTIKGFKSFKHADLWLNAYFIRRRLKKFTDCTRKFKDLNGHSSLELSMRSREKIPKIF